MSEKLTVKEKFQFAGLILILISCGLLSVVWTVACLWAVVKIIIS